MKQYDQIINASLMRKIFSYFIFIIIMMFLLDMYSVYGYKRFNMKFYEMYGQLVEAHSITMDMDELEDDVENYVHSGTVRYIDEYTANLNLIHNKLRHLKAKNTGSIYYRYVDIQNMIITFDEKSRLIFKEYENGKSQIYLNHYVTELKRLNGYIDDEIKKLHFQKLLETQTYYESFFRSMSGNEMLIYITAGFITLLCFIIAYRFSKQISVPIHKLVLSLKEVASGQFDSEPLAVGRNSGEINILISSFNMMKKRLRDLLDEMTAKANIENELKEEKINNLQMAALLHQSELKFLQLQINPHFLFNTLNTISALADMENAQETKKLLDSMAGILRFNLKKINEFVTLREEYQIIMNYLNIQQTRFGDRISYDIKVDEAAMACKIPSMIIQPFVENAITHGLEPKEGEGKLLLEITEDAENIYIAIEDDGVGMPANTLERFSVLTKEDMDSSNSIGIVNVIRRLDLTYGKNVVDICSKPGYGTCVRIKVPKRQCEKN